MPRIVRTPRAKADALSIGRYIAEQSGSRSVALRFLDKIDAKLKFLARHPLAGEARPELASDVRSFPVGNYVIFYRTSEDGIDVLQQTMPVNAEGVAQPGAAVWHPCRVQAGMIADVPRVARRRRR